MPFVGAISFALTDVSKSNQVVRLVLVGGCDTGKTCLLRRFLGGYFDHAGQQDYARRAHEEVCTVVLHDGTSSQALR